MPLVAQSQDKAVLVTGASSGIGQATALELDRSGFRVLASVRTAEAEARLRELASPRLEVLRIDLTKPDTISEAARIVETKVGDVGLWGLVNNAGVALTGPVEFLEPETWRQQFEVNFFGHVNLIRHFLPMLRKARGRVVNISSISGRVSPPYFGPYTCSKFALEALSDVLRVELRRFGIHVIVVEPGNTQTAIWERSRQFAEEKLEAWGEKLASLPREVRSIYEEDFDAMRRATDWMATSGRDVKTVVHTILRALSARRPKTRYPVGWQVKATFLIFRFLPDRLRDRVLCWALGLP